MQLAYDESTYPVRADVAAAHARAWQRLAAPGTWLDGAMRVAIAAETRHAPACAHCAAVKQALSPATSAELHDAVTALPAIWVDAIHRIRNDAPRLSDTWLNGLRAEGLEDPQIVEMTGVIATVVAIDTFTDALGLPRHPLPEPLPGEPSRTLPAGARPGVGRFATVAPEDVTQGEADLYAQLSGANIHRALSLVPAEVKGFFDLDTAMYLPDKELRNFGNETRALTHAQIELIAARVSAINQCFY